MNNPSSPFGEMARQMLADAGVKEVALAPPLPDKFKKKPEFDPFPHLPPGKEIRMMSFVVPFGEDPNQKMTDLFSDFKRISAAIIRTDLTPPGFQPAGYAVLVNYCIGGLVDPKPELPPPDQTEYPMPGLSEDAEQRALEKKLQEEEDVEKKAILLKEFNERFENPFDQPLEVPMTDAERGGAVEIGAVKFGDVKAKLAVENPDAPSEGDAKDSAALDDM